MPIRFLCQHCRKRNSISSRMAGKTVKCPRCGQETLVAEEDDVSAANASANLGSPSAAAPVAERTANPFAKAAFDAFRTAEEELADEEPREKLDDEENEDPSAVARVGSAFALPKSHVAPPIPAKLEIRGPNGKTFVRELSKSQPILFGRHMTNDVVIDEDGVASLHGRISWNGSDFELTAAGKDGIEINGTLVKQRTLEDDDLIRIGSFDIAFVIEEASAPIKKPSTASGLALKRSEPAE